MSLLPSNAQERRRGGRLTPYSHHSRSRCTGEEKSTLHAPSDERKESRKDVFKAMVGRVCRLYSVSPLWQFNTTQQALDSYSKQLTGLLAALPYPAPKGQSRTCPYRGVVSGLKTNSDLSGDYDIIVVQVTTRPRNSLAGTPPLCTAVLCAMSKPQLQVTGFTYLPMLVLQGPANMSTVIMDWLKSSFDCCITPHKLYQDTLTALAQHYAGKQKSAGRSSQERLGGVKLVYQPPSDAQGAGLKHISIELPYDSTAALQRGGGGDSMLDTIRDMVHTHFSLKLSSLTLIGVSTPLIQILSNGSVKFMSTNEVFQLLSTVQ